VRSVRTIPLAAVAVVAVVITHLPPAPARADGDDDRIDVLAEEIRRLKENLAIPETDAELASWGGLGPAASKVYRVHSGLSLGGYGEFYYQKPTRATGEAATGDYYRFIAYVGYKFTPRILMNTEIEYEHATTSANHAGKSGSVSVEFSYLDFLLSDGLNVRAGNLLVPVGIVNEMHEPPFYRGSFRPTVEQTIIPTTWRELGAGMHGEPAAGLAYKLYVVNGLNAKEFGPTGIRSGRQSGNRVLFEDVAAVGSFRWEATGALGLGGSAFVGNSGQGQEFDGAKPGVRTAVVEGHAQFRHRDLELRALVASTTIGDAEALSADLGEVIPERQLGWYLEAAYDVARPAGLPEGHALRPWIRWEEYDLQAEVPSTRTADPELDARSVTVGLEYLPTTNVVLKADWTWQDNAAGTSAPDPFRLGAGFVF
jgi:hypothetical protein